MAWKLQRHSGSQPAVLYTPFVTDLLRRDFSDFAAASSFGLLVRQDCREPSRLECVSNDVTIADERVCGVWLDMRDELFNLERLLNSAHSPLLPALADLKTSEAVCLVFHRDLFNPDRASLLFLDARQTSGPSSLARRAPTTAADPVLEMLHKQQTEIEKLQTKLANVLEMLSSKRSSRPSHRKAKSDEADDESPAVVEGAASLRGSRGERPVPVSFEARYDMLRQSFSSSSAAVKSTTRIRSPSSSSEWTPTEGENDTHMSTRTLNEALRASITSAPVKLRTSALLTGSLGLRRSTHSQQPAQAHAPAQQPAVQKRGEESGSTTVSSAEATPVMSASVSSAFSFGRDRAGQWSSDEEDDEVTRRIMNKYLKRN